MVISAEPRLLQVVRAVVRHYALETGFGESDADCLTVAVDEAMANVIRHAYRSQPQDKIALEIWSYPDRIEVAIEDRGPKVRPEAIRPRPLDEVRPGGLGSLFIKCFTDSSAYDETFTNGNRLKLVKYLRNSEP